MKNLRLEHIITLLIIVSIIVAFSFMQIGMSIGYSDGYDSARMGKDVPYVDVVNFVGSENITEYKHIEGVFECMNSAVLLKERANSKGIRCGIVFLDLNIYIHAVNVFNSTDKGMVYYDQINGVFIAEPKVGYGYLSILGDGVEGRRGYFRSNTTEYNNLIESIHIIW